MKCKKSLKAFLEKNLELFKMVQQKISAIGNPKSLVSKLESGMFLWLDTQKSGVSGKIVKINKNKGKVKLKNKITGKIETYLLSDFDYFETQYPR